MAEDPAASLWERRLGLRGDCVAELRGLGERRRAARAEAQAVLERVEELLPEAVCAGLTLAEIARLSDVSRPTLYALKERTGSARRPIDEREAAALAEAAAELGIDVSPARAR